MSDNIETIRQFVQAWSTLDAQTLGEYFTDDGTYHNMPVQPVSGRAQVVGFIEQFLSSWTATTWDILSIAEAGETVFCERIDRTQTSAGNVDLPCVGVFEMENGKIKVWRDYFDMNTYTNAMK